MTSAARLDLPDWPRLMREDLASSYLGIGVTMLRERGPQPKRLGRCVLYDRHDLDRWADVLGGQPLDVGDRADEGGDILRRVKARLANGQG